MKFKPENYWIPDKAGIPFIDTNEITDYLEKAKPDKSSVREIIDKAIEKNRLSLEEVAILIKSDSPEQVDQIKEGAGRLKELVYGNRIVLFAPLYIGSLCRNDCLYCGFRVSNKHSVRTTLTQEKIASEVKALEEQGQKRLILVFGEHPDYNADFIADCARLVYSVKNGKGEIRRVNINAAPLSVEEFKTVAQAGIGTYQIFQETYEPEIYKRYHPKGNKSNYENRLVALDKAQEAGLDDVGIGALFGLYDWRFEVMGLVRHTNHLEACFNIGPHTISFPRLQDASNVNLNTGFKVSDYDFSRLVAILRLAVPYAGLILTARENAKLRKEVMRYGVSQIDGGTNIELGAYSAAKHKAQDLLQEQFHIGDNRTLLEVIEELLDENYLPSFCTACYRLGRTGEHFMEFSVPGFIKHFCSPNAILTLAEYLEDYATPELVVKGWRTIDKNLSSLDGSAIVPEIRKRLERIHSGERDLYF